MCFPKVSSTPRHTKENNNFSVFPLYRIEKEESEIRVVFQQYLNRQSPKRMDAVTSRQTQYNSPSVLNGRRAQQHRAVHFSKVEKKNKNKKTNNKSKITGLSLKHSPTQTGANTFHQHSFCIDSPPIFIFSFWGIFFFFGTTPAGRTSLYPTLLGSHLLPLND
jgi:hypothetical protein